MRAAILAGLAGLALGFAGGSAAGGAWARHLQEQLAAAQGAILEAQERAGAACEPVWMAAWPDLVCEAGWKGWRPAAECAPRVVVYRHPDLERVRARARAVGPRLGITLYEERGAKERLVPVSWDPEVSP